MEEFLEIFGNNNILIVFGIIVLIVVALFIILLIERRTTKKYFLELKKMEHLKNENNKINIKEEKKIEEEVVTPIKEEKEIVYSEKKETPEEAKKAIEEAAKKMVYEEKLDIVGPTYFEKMQEENSIISYDELVNSKVVKDYENNLLHDLGNEPITIDELYELKEEEQEVVKFQEKEEEKINDNPLEVEIKKVMEENTYYTTNESKKFKNSDVISPVFGVKRDVVFKKEYNELGETVNIEALDLEIKKTEEFLKELKKLKSKLD